MTTTTLRAYPRSFAVRRINRGALTAVGLLLVAVGVLTVLLGAGVLLPDRVDSPVLAPEVSGFAADTGWFWPVAAAAGVVLALLALRWLLLQLRSNHLGDIAVEDDRSRGETVLAPSAVTGAVDAEIGSFHGVEAAVSSLREHHGRTLLLIRVRLDGRAGVAQVREAIEDRAVAHARQALDAPDLEARIEITVAPRRVRHTR
jgi:hypothetical protein